MSNKTRSTLYTPDARAIAPVNPLHVVTRPYGGPHHLQGRMARSRGSVYLLPYNRAANLLATAVNDLTTNGTYGTALQLEAAEAGEAVWIMNPTSGPTGSPAGVMGTLDKSVDGSTWMPIVAPFALTVPSGTTTGVLGRQPLIRGDQTYDFSNWVRFGVYAATPWTTGIIQVSVSMNG